jgi:hypothetical protein
MGFKGRFAAEKQENPRTCRTPVRAVETNPLAANDSQQAADFRDENDTKPRRAR